MQIETILGYLPDTDVSSILTIEQLDLITEKFNKGITRLKELKKSLPNDYTYPQIRVAIAKILHHSS